MSIKESFLTKRRLKKLTKAKDILLNESKFLLSYNEQESVKILKMANELDNHIDDIYEDYKNNLKWRF